jgi:hypothetical protein
MTETLRIDIEIGGHALAFMIYRGVESLINRIMEIPDWLSDISFPTFWRIFIVKWLLKR